MLSRTFQSLLIASLIAGASWAADNPFRGQMEGTGFLNVFKASVVLGVAIGSPDQPSAATWYDSGLSSQNCDSVDAMMRTVLTWPNGKIKYHFYGPNSNTAAEVIGLSGGFFIPFGPPGSIGWLGYPVF